MVHVLVFSVLRQRYSSAWLSVAFAHMLALTLGCGNSLGAGNNDVHQHLLDSAQSDSRLVDLPQEEWVDWVSEDVDFVGSPHRDLSGLDGCELTMWGSRGRCTIMEFASYEDPLFDGATVDKCKACKEAAEGSRQTWDEFCRTHDKSSGCWSKGPESKIMRVNYCNDKWC